MNLIKELLKSARLLMGEYVENKVWSPSELNISQMEVGGKVELIDADGQLSPAPDGNYELEDGSKFTVKDSVIESIEGQEVPAEEDVPVENAEQPKEEVPAEAPKSEPNPELEELKSKVSELEGQLSELLKVVEELKSTSEVVATKEDVAEYSKNVKDLNQTIQQLAKVPVQFSQTTTNNVVKDNKEKLLDFAMVLGSAKK